MDDVSREQSSEPWTLHSWLVSSGILYLLGCIRYRSLSALWRLLLEEKVWQLWCYSWISEGSNANALLNQAYRNECSNGQNSRWSAFVADSSHCALRNFKKLYIIKYLKRCDAVRCWCSFWRAWHVSFIGFDVWMINVRGNTYSRNHTHLDPCSTCKDFWSFGVEEVRYHLITIASIMRSMQGWSYVM